MNFIMKCVILISKKGKEVANSSMKPLFSKPYFTKFYSTQIKCLVVVCVICTAVLLNGCTHMKERSTSEMPNLNISALRDREIPINLIQYRNLYEDDPTHEEDWKLVIFAEEVGFRNGDIVLVAQDYYLVDGDLMYISEVSDQETTNDRIIPYLQSKIDRKTLLK